MFREGIRVDGAELLELCFTRACMYLTKGYIDSTEKDDFTVMDWETHIIKEVLDDCKRIPSTSESY